MLGELSNIEGQHGPAPVTSVHVPKESAEHEEGEEDEEGLPAPGIATKVSRLLPSILCYNFSMAMGMNHP